MGKIPQKQTKSGPQYRRETDPQCCRQKRDHVQDLFPFCLFYSVFLKAKILDADLFGNGKVFCVRLLVKCRKEFRGHSDEESYSSQKHSDHGKAEDTDPDAKQDLGPESRVCFRKVLPVADMRAHTDPGEKERQETEDAEERAVNAEKMLGTLTVNRYEPDGKEVHEPFHESAETVL